MAITKTTRFGLTRWSADTDAWDRADFDADNAATEALGVTGRYAGLKSARGLASAWARSLFQAGDDLASVFWSSGSNWFRLVTGQAWKAYAPVLTGVTGNVDYARYSVVDGTVTVAFKFQTTAATTDLVSLAMPLPMRVDTPESMAVGTWFALLGNGQTAGVILSRNAATPADSVNFFHPGLSNNDGNSIGAGGPTLASGGTVAGTFTYECAPVVVDDPGTA